MASTPKEVEFCIALEDYRDDHNNICLRKGETVFVLDRVSHPGMYKVVKLLADGSQGDEILVPATVLQRKKSTAEIIMPAGNSMQVYASVNDSGATCSRKNPISLTSRRH